MLTQNDAQGALEVALAEVGHASSSESEQEAAPEAQSEESEEEAMDNDPEMQDMQQQLLDAVQLPAPAAEFVPFSGRCFRLDDA